MQKYYKIFCTILLVTLGTLIYRISILTKFDVVGSNRNYGYQDTPGENPVFTNAHQQVQQALFRPDINNHLHDTYVNPPIYHPHPHGNARKKPPLNIPLTLIHLDLKGAPPTLPFLTQTLLPLLSKVSMATSQMGLLMEYEDMFPYKNSLIRSSHAFSRHALETFLLTAINEYGMEIVPLVQTFGHLEYVLKHGEYKGYREVPNHPQEICPLNKNATLFVEDVLLDVVDFHLNVFKKTNKKLKYVHVGLDEVWHLGVCPRCRERVGLELYLQRVREVGGILKKYGVRGIMWDDMLRGRWGGGVTGEGVGGRDYFENMDLMVWDYTPNVDNLVPPYVWPMYGKHFHGIWAASAFKGAFGEGLYTVDVKKHLDNHVSWVNVLTRELPQINNSSTTTYNNNNLKTTKTTNNNNSLKGLALTGWSRYDHFATLCELLPAAIPSLVINLEYLHFQDVEKALKSSFKLLNCSNSIEQMIDLNNCNYFSSNLNYLLSNLKSLESSWLGYYREIKHEKGWLTKWNVDHLSSTSFRVKEIKERVLTEFLGELKRMEGGLRGELGRWFEGWVVGEWVELRVGWLIVEMEGVVKEVEGIEVFWMRN